MANVPIPPTPTIDFTHTIMDASLAYGQTEKILFQVTLALVLGIFIGFERKLHGNSKMFPFLLITTGSCLLAIVSRAVSVADNMHTDLTRIAAGVVVGVGFLGSGFILKERHSIVGMTNAAMIWVSAAIGLAVGFDYYILAGYCAALLSVILNIPMCIRSIRDEPKDIERGEVTYATPHHNADESVN